MRLMDDGRSLIGHFADAGDHFWEQLTLLSQRLAFSFTVFIYIATESVVAFLMNPSNESPDEPPPAYSEVPPISPKLFEEPRRAITSGPTEYEAKSGLLCIISLYMVFLCITKIGISIAIISYYLGSSGTEAGIGMTLTLFAVLDSLNFWPYKFLTNDQNKTISNRNHCHWGFLAFFVDCGFVIMMGFVAISNNKSILIVVACATIFIFNILILILIMRSDINSYNPCEGNNKYFFAKKFEESFYEEKTLSIKESGPFRIRIQNCGAAKWTSPLKFERIIGVNHVDNKGRPYVNKEKTRFFLKQISIEPGEILTLIPEPHHEPKTQKVIGFRAFGLDKGDFVHTALYNESGLCIVRLTEEFKKDEFRRTASQKKRLQSVEEGEPEVV